MKRLLSLLLILAIYVNCLPTCSAAGPDPLQEWDSAVSRRSNLTVDQQEEFALKWLATHQMQPELLKRAFVGRLPVLMRPKVLLAMAEHPDLKDAVLFSIQQEIHQYSVPPRVEWLDPLKKAISGASADAIDHFFTSQMVNLRPDANPWFKMGSRWKELLEALIHSPAIPARRLAQYYSSSTPEHQNVLSRLIFPQLEESKLLTLASEPTIAKKLISDANPKVITQRWIETWLILTPSPANEQIALIEVLKSNSRTKQALENLFQHYSVPMNADTPKLIAAVRPKLPRTPEAELKLKNRIIELGRYELVPYLICPDTQEWTMRTVLPDVRWIEQLDLIEYLIRTDSISYDKKYAIIRDHFLNLPHWKEHPELFTINGKTLGVDSAIRLFTYSGKTFIQSPDCLAPLLQNSFRH